VCDGVLVHSLLGNCKPGDIPADVRIKAIALLVDRYFRPGTVIQAGYPLDSASPVRAEAAYCSGELRLLAPDRGARSRRRELTARSCASHFRPDSGGRAVTRPLKIDWTFWCCCGGMASARTCRTPTTTACSCPAQCANGSRMATRPAEFSRPEVLEVLRAPQALACPTQANAVEV
jgi:sulfate adenylyltransferase